MNRPLGHELNAVEINVITYNLDAIYLEPIYF